jgi:hypothetical protein
MKNTYKYLIKQIEVSLFIGTVYFELKSAQPDMNFISLKLLHNLNDNM